MKNIFLTIILLMFTVLPTFAAINNSSGPWGIDIASFTNLSTAKRSPATSGKPMVVTSTMNCGNLTIPADRPVEVIKGGRIRYSGNLIIKGPFKAGLYHVLEKVGSGTVTFESNPDIPPEWWGAVGGNVAGYEAVNNAALQSAVDAAPAYGGRVILNSQYRKSGSVNVRRRFITIAGFNKGTRSTIVDAGGMLGTGVIQTTEEPAFQTIIAIGESASPAIHYYSSIHYRDFSIYGPSTTGAAVGIKVYNANSSGTIYGTAVDDLVIEGMSISNLGTGIFAWGLDVPRVRNNWICENGKALDMAYFYHADIGSNVYADNAGLPSESNLYGGMKLDNFWYSMVHHNTGGRNVRFIRATNVLDSIMSDNITTDEKIAFDIDGYAGGSFHHNIAKITASAAAPTSGTVGLFGANMTDVTMDHNTVKNSHATALPNAFWFVNSSNNLISSNSALGNYTIGINTQSGTENRVINNMVARDKYLNNATGTVFEYIVDDSFLSFPASFQGSWVNSTTPADVEPVHIYKDKNEIVHLTGSCTGGTAGSSILFLPAGFRPTSRQVFPVSANGAYGQVAIETSGNVYLDVGTAPIVFSIQFQSMPLNTF